MTPLDKSSGVIYVECMTVGQPHIHIFKLKQVKMNVNKPLHDKAVFLCVIKKLDSNNRLTKKTQPNGWGCCKEWDWYKAASESVKAPPLTSAAIA
jgi:hypothetical protein